MNVELSYDKTDTDTYIIPFDAMWERINKLFPGIDEFTDEYRYFGPDGVLVYFKGTLSYNDTLVNQLVFKCLANGNVEIIPPYVYLKGGYNASAE